MRALLLVLLLLLTGCSREEVSTTSQPPVEEIPVSAPVPVEKPTAPEVETVEITVKQSPRWHGSEPQQGPAIVPQPGEMAMTYDPSKVADFPADADCSPMELLEKWMTVEGLTWEDLDRRDCDQLVLVVSQGNTDCTTITNCYERSTESWQPVDNFCNLRGYTGSGGIAHNRQRGTRKSPAGLWALGSAFGLREPPENLQLPWRAITEDSDWVGDAESPFFNTWQERTADSTWNLADSEHLADFDQTYTYACVIEFNTPPYVVPERGFAIFFHVSDHPTTGCVALEEVDFVEVLRWLNPHRNPHILITGT